MQYAETFSNPLGNNLLSKYFLAQTELVEVGFSCENEIGKAISM